MPTKTSVRKNPLDWNPTRDSDKNVNTKISLGRKKGYKTVTYPVELGSERYPYFMVFYVNANGKSYLVKNKEKLLSKDSTTNRRVNQGLTANVAGASARVQEGVGKLVQSTSDIVVVNKVTSFIGGAIVAVAKEFAPVSKRLNIALALPVPSNVAFNQSANYTTASSGIMGTLMSNLAAGDISGAGKAMVGKLTQDLPTFAANLAIGAANDLVNGATGTSPFSNTGENFESLKNKIMGIASNDRKEQTFAGMEIRKFSFTWLLIPRSQQESEIIKDMVKWFKYNQYPEIDKTTGGLNLIIPNEFDIEFHYANKEMGGIAKISTCVLESVSVDYSSLGKFVAFDGTDNPVATNLTLNFSEIEPLTREMVAKGF